MSIFSFIFAGVGIGMLFSIQASINARLSSISKNPFTVSLMLFSLGAFILLLINFLLDPVWMSSGIDTSYPIYVYIGGSILGVGFNVLNIFLFAKLGASVSILVTITGQMIMGILIDNFGWFEVPMAPFRISTLTGSLLLIAAIILSQPKKKRGVTSTSPHKTAWILVGLAGGALPMLQTAINNLLRTATNSPFKATLITFVGAMLILMVIVWIKDRRIDIPRRDAQGKRLPIWMYISGVLAALIVTGNVVLLPALGSVVMTMVTLFGQMMMALLIDHFGMFRLPRQQVSRRRILALLLMVTGIVIVKLL